MSKKKISIIGMVCLLCAAGVCVFQYCKRKDELVAFQERIHMVERMLDAWKRDHGEYPQKLDAMRQDDFIVDATLTGATFTYYGIPAAGTNQLLLSGKYRAHVFEIRSGTGFAFH